MARTRGGRRDGESEGNLPKEFSLPSRPQTEPVAVDPLKNGFTTCCWRGAT